jgi:hypothetical protein
MSDLRCPQKWKFVLWSSRVWHLVAWQVLPNFGRNTCHSVIITYVDAIVTTVNLTSIFLTCRTVCRISGCIDRETRMLQSERRILRQGVLRARVICMNIIGRSDRKTDFNYWGQRLVSSSRKSGDGEQWILPYDYQQNKHCCTMTIGEHVIYWKISPSLTHTITGRDVFVVPK